MLTAEKIAKDRDAARNLGVEAAIRKLATSEQDREDLRTIYKEAAEVAASVTAGLMSGNPRISQQIKTAFMNHGVPVLENAMSKNDKYSELRKAAAEGLTPKKILTDRQNAFEIGTEGFIEKVGMDDKTAQDFRGIMAQGLAELSENPELVKQALAETK